MPDDDSDIREVCVVDDGYDLGHEDLPFDDTSTLITGEFFVSGYGFPFTNIGSHGTHVTGTIAAIGGNDIGVKGVIRNGNLKLHIARVAPHMEVQVHRPLLLGLKAADQMLQIQST